MADIIVPSAGESITEVFVAAWLVEVGEQVEIDQPIVSLETDKASMDVPSPVAGVMAEQLVAPDDSANVGDVIGRITEGATADVGTHTAAKTPSAPAKSAPVAAASKDDKDSDDGKDSDDDGSDTVALASKPTEKLVMPSAARILAEADKDADGIDGSGPGGRVLKEDAMRAVAAAAPAAKKSPAPMPRTVKRPQAAARPAPAAPRAVTTTASIGTPGRTKERVKMTRLRRRIADRLVQAQNDAAILTTFNEADMTAVMNLRGAHKQAFVDKHGIKLGFMSFFVKACVDALKGLPNINAQIEGDEIVYHDYFDIGVAVGGGKGLVVPVIRNCERLSFAEIELTIADYGRRAKEGTLGPDEMTGGTFTISNGGVYGSMMSTPILNPPQSGILGMHNIQKRAVVVDDTIVIRPMMYLALSYDHRIVDGREAVTFLRRVKDCIESPERMLLEI